tara:strand:- start:118 stop:222 length:105 start_codon:yes stop_codon:yes gene_type:complete
MLLQEEVLVEMVVVVEMGILRLLIQVMAVQEVHG